MVIGCPIRININTIRQAFPSHSGGRNPSTATAAPALEKLKFNRAWSTQLQSRLVKRLRFYWWQCLPSFLIRNLLTKIKSYPPQKKKALKGDFPEAHSHFFKNPTLTSLCIISFWNIITWLSQMPPISSLYQSWFLMLQVSVSKKNS